MHNTVMFIEQKYLRIHHFSFSCLSAHRQCSCFIVTNPYSATNFLMLVFFMKTCVLKFAVFCWGRACYVALCMHGVVYMFWTVPWCCVIFCVCLPSFVSDWLYWYKFFIAKTPSSIMIARLLLYHLSVWWPVYHKLAFDVAFYDILLCAIINGHLFHTWALIMDHLISLFNSYTS